MKIRKSEMVEMLSNGPDKRAVDKTDGLGEHRDDHKGAQLSAIKKWNDRATHQQLILRNRSV